jgi:SET domain-containing protein
MNYRGKVVRAAASPHGLGLFSLRSFHHNDRIGPIDGQVIDDPEYESDYCMELGGAVLEPVSPFRYINHSCRPNCELVELSQRETRSGLGELWLEALCEIAPGEQMTIDYAWPARAAVPCGCGCDDCRGWIVALDEIDAVDREGRSATE